MKILIIGAGLVGSQIANQLLMRKHKVVITTLPEKNQPPRISSGDRIKIEYANILFPYRIRKKQMVELFSDDNESEVLLNFCDSKNNRSVLSSTLFHVINRYQPNVIIDSMNTAGGISRLTSKIRQKIPTARYNTIGLSFDLLSKYYQHLSIITSSTFQNENNLNIKSFIKIGTTGIGGMGLNLPFTHGDDQPSSQLMLKVGLAGAETGFLFGLKNNRDIDVIEIIPAGAVFLPKLNLEHWSETVQLKKSKYRYFDGGESGKYSIDEFGLITSSNLMGLVDVSYVAKEVVSYIDGKRISHNILEGLDRKVIRRNKKSDLLRRRLLNRKTNLLPIAYGNLGPPQITKYLFEIRVVKDIMKDHPNWEDYSLSRQLQILKGIATHYSKQIRFSGLKLAGVDHHFSKRKSSYSNKKLDKKKVGSMVIDCVDFSHRNIYHWIRFIKEKNISPAKSKPYEIVEKYILES
ncbi:MAG: hypothetical protein HY340_02410 [Candidatus Kerfeldbacteria bacterium]|nr:hypothetical protein [Candidatus Kerfeldbacteria bacterium]